jgi:hypothetical protein
MRRIFLAFLLLAGWAQVQAASTDATASFTVTLADPPNNYNRRVDAFWVTDASGKFVQNVRKDAATRQQYLYQWAAVRTTTTIDGYSGATISTWGSVTVAWDCRDVNNVVVPDGTYKFWVEFTDKNGQGPYTTNGIAFVKGTAASTNTFPNQTYITGIKVVYTPLHDVGITSLTPAVAPANTNVNVSVRVTNLTANVESFSLILSNLTTSSLVGTQNVTALAAKAGSTISFPWSTTNLSGSYTLQATANPLAGETATANNVLTSAITVQSTAHDIAVLNLLPSLAPPDSAVTVQTLVTNLSSNQETFVVAVSNLTGSALIGSRQVTLAGTAATNITFPWSTTGLLGDYTLKSVAGPVASEPSIADNSLTNVVTIRPIVRDLAVTRLLVPAILTPGTSNNIGLVVTNAGELGEAISVSLTDDTDARLLGSGQATNLAAGAGTNFVFVWRTTNSIVGYHRLRAVAAPLAGETSLLNNTNALSVPVTANWTTNTLIAKGAVWRYSAEGLDLTDTPWKEPDYYDQTWSAGPGPLGYCTDGHQTNIVTVFGYGPNASDKYPTTYLRTAFELDTLPTALQFRARRDDGAVFYLNGAEVNRMNLPANPVTYTNLATATVSGTNEYYYYPGEITPQRLVRGRNVLAAELHQVNATSSDLVLDAELLGITPVFSVTHDVDVLQLTGESQILSGDQARVSVLVTNAGTAMETVQVFLKDDSTGKILSSSPLSNLYPAQTATVELSWGTLGMSGRTGRIVAFTVAGGITNFAGAVTNSISVIDSFFAPSPVPPGSSIGGRCSAIAVAGTNLFTCAGATLEAWDVSNAQAPVRKASVRLPGLGERITLNGNTAFVSCGKDGVQAVDITSPSAPLLRGTLKVSGHVYDAVAAGPYLYVAAGRTGVRIFNVSNLSAPALAGAYYTAGPAASLALVGTRLYVLDQHAGLQVLDVSSPSAPFLVASLVTVDAGQALAVSGTSGYLVDGNNHFQVLDLSNPAAPAIRGSLVLPGLAGRALAVNGNRVYVAAGKDGLLVVDTSNPAAPVLGSSPVSGEALGLSMAGLKLYVAGGFQGFQVFDATAPASPTLLADSPSGLRASDVVMTNSLAYVAGGEGGLRIFSLTNPASPQLLSRFSGITNARSIALMGSIACVGDGLSGTKLVDVSNPLSPSLAGSFVPSGLGSIRAIGISGTQAVVTDGHKVVLLNLTTPATPSQVDSYTPPGFVFSLAVSGGKTFLACGNGGLVILSLTPGGFVPVGTYPSPFFSSGVSVSGDLAYLAHPDRGWELVNVSNPGQPVFVKEVLANGGVKDLAASGSNMVLSTVSRSAVSVDISTPLSPVPISAFAPLFEVLRLRASPSVTIAAEDEAGLSLLPGPEGDFDGDGLPDFWEQQILSMSLLTNGPLRTIWDVRPQDDFDGDGLSNGAEYVAGTNPADPGSVFMTSARAQPGTPGLILQWNSVAGRTYAIYKAADLNGGFTLLKDNIQATPPLNTEVDTNAAATAFYVIGVR